ncbi:iron complex transport system substrate-binding protein [Tamaricihabitans halophyticus]|uniref:Iron complex transport system substrate-binding protein n=1 Tax=Tamaricihabitans halophyticus TaxID=1262583 RepID=A0A4V2SSW8_9PSEU|nr:iron-siderophore ABC transporter substrate-binding protein [Tamaricihabitans halophyticus]TCP48456.1 iron complex transport system substrate-binding protein [Tamaricihabitans halophyticus]
MRRRAGTMLTIAVAGALFAASACSTETPDAGSGQSGAGDAAAYPVTIDTEFGAVTIEEPPQRVVALGWSDAEVALALGVQPVGAADWLDIGGDGLGPWVEQSYQEPPEMLGTLEVNREKLAELNPDLILDTRASGEQERYDQLSELGVPVVGPPEDANAYLTSWQDQLAMIGKALGKQAEATELREGLEAEFATAARQNPEFRDASVVLGVRSASSYAAYVRGGGRVEFMEELGFRNSPAIQQLAGEDFSVPVSEERLDLLDADLTVMFLIGVDAKEVTQDPLYQAVPSVQDGRSVVLSEETVSQAFSSASVAGLSYALDKTVPMFAEALRG